MAVWDELKVVLARLRDQQPGTLMQHPTLEVDEGRQPPFTIRLAPWAAATAEELHQQVPDGPAEVLDPLLECLAAFDPAAPGNEDEVLDDEIVDGVVVLRRLVIQTATKWPPLPGLSCRG